MISTPPSTIPPFTDTRTRIEISDTREREKSETIQFGYNFNFQNTKEKHQTDFNFNKTEKEENANISNKYSAIDEFAQDMIFTTGFSEDYIEYNSVKMVDEILSNLHYWLENGTENSYHIIASIKDSINYYAKYLTYKNENRLFLNGIKLLLNNNNWENVDSNKLKSFIFEVSRFKDGNINWDRLELFSKQIKRLKINTIKEDGEKEIKEG